MRSVLHLLRTLSAASWARRQLALVVACVLVIGACGGDDDAAQREREATQRRQEQQRLARERSDEARKQADQARELQVACSDQLGTLVDRLGELDSRLSVGLNYDEYTDEVAELRVAYDKIDLDDTGVSCLSGIGIPAEGAVNQYAKAAGRWGECIDDFSCDTDAIEPALQRRWSKAAEFVETAKDELDQLGDEASELEQEANELADAASQPGATDTGQADEPDASPQPDDSAAEFTRAVNDAAAEAVDTVTMEDSGRVAVYLNFGEDAEALEDKICDAIAEVEPNARASIHQYHDRGRDTTYIAGTCGTLKTP